MQCPSAAITREGATDRYGDSVCWRVTQGSGSSFRALASDLNKSDVDLVSVQHEFGLYGGWDGTYTDHLGPFLAMLHKPAITTFHTVLPAPEPAQLAAVCDIAARSAAVIVMTDVAQRLLVTVYGLPAGKIHVIPHGVPVMRPGLHPEVRARLGLAGRTVITTFGLVDPRKGIEFMVEGMATVAQRDPRALYLVLGKSHPELVAREGERYRATIEDLVARRGLQGHVRLVNRYLAEEDIVDYLEATDVYVTPYLDPNQITSGTLAYALGAGRAIVSTSYLHAVEALDRGRGLLVDFRSAGSLSAAVLRVIEEPGLRSDLERSAHAWGATTYWPQVARTTAALFRRVAAEVRPQRKGPVVNARTRVAVAGPR
ncbi:MAG: glycosyltransferase [Dehalococcoidia bacterium]